MVENKLVIPDEMVQYLNQTILGTDSVTPAAKSVPNNPPDPQTNATNDDHDDSATKDNTPSDVIDKTNNSSEKISDVATSDDSLIKNLGAIGSDLNISDIPVDLRSLDVSMSGNSGSLLAPKSPEDKNPLQEQVIPEVNAETNEQDNYASPPVNVEPTNPLHSLQTMTAKQTAEIPNMIRMNANNPPLQKQNPSSSPKQMVMSPQCIPQNVLSPQSMMSPQSLPRSTISPHSVMSPQNITQCVMSPPSVYNVMSPQSVMSVMSPQSMMSPQHQMMMSPRQPNIGSPMSQNMTSPMMNMASPMHQNVASPMSHGITSPMHPGMQSPMAQGLSSPMLQNLSNVNTSIPTNQNIGINQTNHMMAMAAAFPNNPQQHNNPKRQTKNFNGVYPNNNVQYPMPNNQNFAMRNQNMQPYQMVPQYQSLPIQNQLPLQNQQGSNHYNGQMINYNRPPNYSMQNQSNQMHPLQMSRSSMMSVDNSGNMSRGTMNSYCEQQNANCTTMSQQSNQYNQTMHYPHPPPYNAVISSQNVMGPPPPKPNQYNQVMVNNNQYYNHQRPYNQWEYPNNNFVKPINQKSLQNSVNMSTGSQNKMNGVRNSVNCNQMNSLKNAAEQQTDCSMNSIRSQNNQASDVQVWDISQSQIEASNGRKKNQNTMRQDTYQRTLEYVENCENWKNSEMVSSTTHPLHGGEMVLNELPVPMNSFYEENQYLQMIQ